MIQSKGSTSIAIFHFSYYNEDVNEWSAHGQSDINLERKGQVVADTGTKSDINLEHKGQVVADTGINRPVINGSVLGRFFFLEVKNV